MELNETLEGASFEPGAHIRCKVTADAKDAFSQDRLNELANKLANYARLELRNTMYNEYTGKGFEISERLGMTDALKILGCKVEYYEEELEDGKIADNR